jgi:2-polyprenyl-3-methyl-5-hydroxy-6-metoxy-1,4-benzoquinol methylase
MDFKDVKVLDDCLCCGSERLKLVLDLNEQPLANSYKKSAEDQEPYFPLRLNICEDCTHLQLSHAVNPDLLFKNYLYVSGTSQTLRDYFEWFAKRTIEYFEFPPSTVLDIACNDGSQLNSFKALGLKTYGIDPAENLHKLSNSNHEVVCDYFTNKYTYHYKNKNLDIITAQNVFAHNSYPLDFLLECKEIMHDNSRLFVQTSQADMIKNNEFDTIYHEHLSFFNSNSMKALADRAGLHIIDIQKTPIHGNSYVFVMAKNPGARPSVQNQLDQEREQGLQDMNTYLTYAEGCHTVIEDLNATIAHYRELGYVIVGYGAAAKGMTLLNFGQTSLDYIIDDNPLKQGLYTPGMNIPIVSIDILEELRERPIAFVPLAWNFFKEIKGKIKANRDVASDVFIKYFPTIKVE